ncbi:MAG: hypothetical protein LVQ96_01990 [Thermoplasmatales archaeon]|nr:hypothetical protein [Thermoplasmatales archaeon]MCW6169922.1 hypothetical protein [Thermoplasmatales archaeon]
MRPSLLFNKESDRVFDELPWSSNDLVKDFELERVFNAMSGGDKELKKIAMEIVLNPIMEQDTIKYRQKVIEDSLKNSEIIRDIYDRFFKSVSKAREHHFWMGSSNPEYILNESISILSIYIDTIEYVRGTLIRNSNQFSSNGFRSLVEFMQKNFSSEYIRDIRRHLANLSFERGISVRGKIGKANSISDYMLLKPKEIKHALPRISLRHRNRHYTYVLPERDEAGAQALSAMRRKAIIDVTNALQDSAENVLGFINEIEMEIGFCVASINLYDAIEKTSMPIVFPIAQDFDGATEFRELCDISLGIKLQKKPVGNNLSTDKLRLLVITGANGGGKSTFLRSLGQAQLLMQSGLFVSAEYAKIPIVHAIFTHFKREEDAGMDKGKFDEELSRMNLIVDHLMSRSLVCFNESFAATNSIEGSEIAKQIINALIEKNIKVFFVTHLYDLAAAYYDKRGNGMMFVRANRLETESPSFKIVEGKPLPTSYGEDLYNSIFH